MPSMTSVKYSNKKFRKIFTISGIAVAAVVLISVGIWLLIRNGVFYKKEDTAGNDYSMSAEMSQVLSESAIHKGYMFSRTTKLLSEDRKTEPWVLSWYVIPGTTRSVPAMESTYVDTFDQILLLESYILEGKRSKADVLMNAIDNSLMDESGLLLSFRKADDLTGNGRNKEESCNTYEDPAFLLLNDPPVSMKATTRYLRALMEYYDKWGSTKLLNKIETLAEKIFSCGEMTAYRSADQAAMPTPIPVTEKSLVTPVPSDEETADNGNKSKETEDKLVGMTGTELSSMDLDALRRVSVLFPKYQSNYEKMVSVVKEGKISGELPLYAWTYSEESGYTYYTGSAGNVELVPSLYVMVYLAEIGQFDTEGYAWISEQFYNTGFLYTSYNMMSGQASSDVEAAEAYPLVMYLAIIKGDNDLFSAAHIAMMRQYATLSTSPALYTFYRDVGDSRVAVYARENLLAELFLK